MQIFQKLSKPDQKKYIYKRDVWCPATHAQQMQKERYFRNSKENNLHEIAPGVGAKAGETNNNPIVSTLSCSLSPSSRLTISHSDCLYENKSLIEDERKRDHNSKSMKNETKANSAKNSLSLSSTAATKTKKHIIVNNHRQAFSYQYRQDALRFCNKLPNWNPDLKSLVLRFNKRRVLAPSAKNFLICDPNELQLQSQLESSNETKNTTNTNKIDKNNPIQKKAQRKMEGVLQFGKIKKRRYAMDFQYPMSPIQAFGICLTFFSWNL